MAQTKRRNMEERRRRILEMAEVEGVVRVTQLSRELEVTPVTIRGDLAAMEKQGQLSRTQGGAVPKGQGFAAQRQPAAGPRKRELAEGLAAMVADGETLLINSGTTTLCAAVALKRRQSLSIVTNSLAIAMELGGRPGFRVILLGGEVDAQFGFSYGADALAQLGRYKADKAILSVDGILPDRGLTTYHAQEAMLDTLMMERAQQTVVLADESKFGRESFSVVASLEKVDTLITNHTADKALVEAVRALGVQVVTV